MARPVADHEIDALGRSEETGEDAQIVAAVAITEQQPIHIVRETLRTPPAGLAIPHDRLAKHFSPCLAGLLCTAIDAAVADHPGASHPQRPQLTNHCPDTGRLSQTGMIASTPFRSCVGLLVMEASQRGWSFEAPTPIQK